MAALEALGGETWFQLGDGDLATHVERTRRLAAGESLSQITDDFRRRLGISARLLPMSDDRGAHPAADRTRAGSISRIISCAGTARPAVARDRLCRRRRRRAPHPDFLAALADPTLAHGRDLPVQPVHQHRPDPGLPGVREALRACRGAGRRGLADHRRQGGQRPDRQDDGRARPAGRRRRGGARITAISSTSTWSTRPMRAAMPASIAGDARPAP